MAWQGVAGHGSLDVSNDEIRDYALRKTERVADAGRDDMLDGSLGYDFFENVRKIFQDNDALGARVVKLVF